MLGDEREDQVPVHGVEHAEQVCGKEECVVVEETCQFRPGDEQGIQTVNSVSRANRSSLRRNRSGLTRNIVAMNGMYQ